MALVTGVVLTVLVMVSQSAFQPLRLLSVCVLAVGLEQLSRWGIDNLSVPIAVGLCWSWMIA